MDILQGDSLPAEPPGKPKNTGVGSLSLLQQIFLTQESNWGLLYCRQILYQLALREAPKWKSLSHVRLFATPWTIHPIHGILQAWILAWVAVSFSRRSSQPRDQTQVSSIAGAFLTSWATREAQEYWSGWPIPSPADLPDPGIKLGSPVLQADSFPVLLSSHPGLTLSFIILVPMIISNYHILKEDLIQ